MARPSPSAIRGIATFTGMAVFISTIAAYPRLSITRTPESTTITYRHLQSPSSTAPPPDQGLILTPEKRPVPTTHRTWTDEDWILDTGATTHVCFNRSLMHSYTGFQHSALSKAVGHFGPNPISIEGMGDVTLTLPASSLSSSSSSAAVGSNLGLVNPLVGAVTGSGSGVRQSYFMSGADSTNARAVGKLTIHNVSYIPRAGINLISWSQLKRAKGLKLVLSENAGGGLSVVRVTAQGTEEIMRFQEKEGLYWLVKEGKSG